MRMLFACLALLAGTAAGAGQKAAPDMAQPAEAQSDRKVCRSVGSTGSRIPSRECRLRSEWQAIDAAQTSQASDMQRRMNDGIGGAMVTNLPIPR